MFLDQIKKDKFTVTSCLVKGVLDKLLSKELKHCIRDIKDSDKLQKEIYVILRREVKSPLDVHPIGV